MPEDEQTPLSKLLSYLWGVTEDEADEIIDGWKAGKGDEKEYYWKKDP